jgi:hypothetical protein
MFRPGGLCAENSGDPKSGHLNIGTIKLPEELTSGNQMVSLKLPKPVRKSNGLHKIAAKNVFYSSQVHWFRN